MRCLRWAPRIPAVLAVLYLCFAALHPHDEVPDHVLFERPGPWVIEHRGGGGLWPEIAATAGVLVASVGHYAMSAFRQGRSSVATSAIFREG
ncbi:MAG: hypothetical protein GY953_25520 [bacterium]|nr:hypothetical protein [bacterium]